MKLPALLAALLLATLAQTAPAQTAPTTAASQPAPGLTPVSTFTAKDFPEAAPGKPVWWTGEKNTAGWGYDIVYFDKWVYATSSAEYILQFARNPATAQLTYLRATPFSWPSEEKNPNMTCRIRRLPDGSAMLTLLSGNHKTGFMWYTIDQSTGTLTPAGQQVPAKFDKHNAQILFTPDQQRFCVGGYNWTKVYWSRFADDGAPVDDGSFPLHNFPTGHYLGSLKFSPDLRHMYYLLLQHSEDPLADKIPQIDTYTIDPQTHLGTYVSSLQLPPVDPPPDLPVKGPKNAHVSGFIVPPSPDGKHLYVFFAGGPFYYNSYYYVLTRDPNTGKLAVASQKNDPSLFGIQGTPYSRPDRLAFTADGRTGYCLPDSAGASLRRFSRDPATGALTFLPPFPDAEAHRLTLDPALGHLFTVGEKITSFRTPAAAAAR